jgi:hypothetical protein
VPYEELAAGHALSALEPEEEQLFLTHLAGCARCERDVAEHRSTLAHLAYAPDAAEPPPALLDSIRAGVLASGRGATFPSDAPPELAAPASLADARSRRGSRPRRAAGWVGVAAAAALVVSLGAWNAVLQQDRNEQAEWGSRLTAAVHELGDPSTTTVPLAGEDGKVVAVALVHDREMSLIVDGLARNEAGTTYVLWAKSRFGDVRPVGAFDVDSDSLDVLRGMQVEAGIADVTAFMVSHEQGDSAPPMPRSAVLASGEA